MSTLREALERAANDLWFASQFLSAIHHSEPSTDRRKAWEKASAGAAAARFALAHPPSPDYVRGQERMRERAAARSDAEEELDGPMPGDIRYALARDPEAVLRGLVRATKNGIASGIRSLPLEDAALDPISEPKCRCGIMVKDAANWNHRADCPAAPAPSPAPSEECRECANDGSRLGRETGKCAKHSRTPRGTKP